MNIKESAKEGKMKVFVWLSNHLKNNKSLKQMTKQDILDYLNVYANQSISNDPSFCFFINLHVLFSYRIKVLTDTKKSKIIKEKIFRKEPEIVVLLRLCYWYHKALQFKETMQYEHCYFNDKLEEIKEELGKQLRTKAEKSGLPIFANYGSDTADYHTQLQSIITERIRKQGKANIHKIILDEIRYSIHRYASECMFYALGVEADFGIECIKIYENKKSPNLEVRSIPAALRILLDNKGQGNDVIEIKEKM